jgi:antitoxin VapB
MGLNIKNEEAHRLATELAKLTGDSLTGSVIKSLRNELDRERRTRSREGVAERLLEIGREVRAHIKGEISSSDIDDMYDEMGLPK